MITNRHGGFSQAPFDSLNLGLHVGDDPVVVQKNREALKAVLPHEPVWLNQIHGNQVVDADEHVIGVLNADASVTTTPGQVLAIMTADCLPVLLASKDGKVVGAAHAGWRGLVAGEDQLCSVVGVGAQVCNARSQGVGTGQNRGLVRQNQGCRSGCTVACGRAVNGDTQKALGVGGCARELDRLLGSVEVEVAVTGTFGKAVVGGHQHTLQFTVIGQ